MLLAYARALVDQWERDLITADDFVRSMRDAIREEDKITQAAEREIAKEIARATLRWRMAP